MEQNCSRVVTWMHRHLVHRLTVGFRVLQRNREAKVEMELDCDLPASKCSSRFASNQSLIEE